MLILLICVCTAILIFVLRRLCLVLQDKEVTLAKKYEAIIKLDEQSAQLVNWFAASIIIALVVAHFRKQIDFGIKEVVPYAATILLFIAAKNTLIPFLVAWFTKPTENNPYTEGLCKNHNIITFYGHTNEAWINYLRRRKPQKEDIYNLFFESVKLLVKKNRFYLYPMLLLNIGTLLDFERLVKRSR